MKKLFFLFLLVAVLAAVWTGRPGRDPGVALSPALDAPSGEVPAVAEQPGDAPLSEPESRTAPDESVQEAGEAPQDPHSADEEPRQAPEAVSEKAATTQIVTPEGDTVRKGTVERGDTVGGLLGSVGTGETQHYLRAARQVFSLRKFRAGQAYVVVTDAATGRVKRFEYEIDDRKRLVVEGLDDPVARLENIAYETRLCFVEGVIASDLFSAVADMGEGPQLALRIANLFAAEINFIRDLQEGDSFRVLVEKLYREGEYKGYGKVLAAAFTNRGKTFEAFLFRDGGGREGHFYNAAGESLRKTLLQAPLPITRVTSRFTNSRKHPILGYSRPHLGVDYGAPSGTPVMAVGSGKVLKAGRAGGFGNQIIVRHHQNLESMYNHLSGYARGIRSGVSVRQGQVIGYVGSTGLSTGPHLDFRIKQNGKFIDPTKAVNPRAPGVSRRKAKEFAAVVAEYRAYMSGAKELSAYKTDEELEEHDSEGR